MPLLKQHTYTSEDYWNLPDSQRAELIDGQLYNMAPPSRMHQRLVMELSATIRDYIRSHHGSKSVTIGNITDAYNKAAHGNGFNEEFVYSDAELQLIDKYADLTGELQGAERAHVADFLGFTPQKAVSQMADRIFEQHFEHLRFSFLERFRVDAPQVEIE